MSREISRSESWEMVYSAFQTVNFSSFDYNTVKASMIEYVKLYFPESFNDYIESSEFVAILELFAYIAEILAYRLDLNAHENFISTAQRKESVLRLAKLISYDATRNVPARGLAKMLSVQTSETVFDSAGRNLAGVRIIWNDFSNPDWKEQFLLVLNLVLQQDFGTVTPNERVQVNDVLFELYQLENNNLGTLGGVFKYIASVSNVSYPMELVPVSLDENGPFERRPANNKPFSILYGSDGLGDSSDTTGFFCYTKQGSLLRTRTNYDGVTPNQTENIEVDDINDTDVWVNEINSETEETTVEWQEVDLAFSQNIVFNTNPIRTKYEVETLEDDQINIVYGDGEFADIPSGTFDIWYRPSANENIVVTQSSVGTQTFSFSYQDRNGASQTFTFTASLINSLQNASISETIDHIRQVAPSVYYTQDRMVNAQDYNTFLLQDPSILKLRAINRTFSGDSKYIPWHDPSQTYENVKMYGDDLIIHYRDLSEEDGTARRVEVPAAFDGNAIVSDFLEPWLSTYEYYLYVVSNGTAPRDVRNQFSEDEKIEIAGAIDALPPTTVDVYYSVSADLFTVDNELGTELLHMFQINPNAVLSGWEILYDGRRLIADSQDTQFWNTNDTTEIITYDTFRPNQDNIIVLSANDGRFFRYMTDPVTGELTLFSTGSCNLGENVYFDVLGQEVVPIGPDVGTRSIHELSIIPTDENGDGVPDDFNVQEILNPKITTADDGIIELPFYYVGGQGDTNIVGTNFNLDSEEIFDTWYQFSHRADWPVSDDLPFIPVYELQGSNAPDKAIFAFEGAHLERFIPGKQFTLFDSVYATNGQYTVSEVEEPYYDPDYQGTGFQVTVVTVEEPQPSSGAPGDTNNGTVRADEQPHTIEQEISTSIITTSSVPSVDYTNNLIRINWALFYLRVGMVVDVITTTGTGSDADRSVKGTYTIKQIDVENGGTPNVLYILTFVESMTENSPVGTDDEILEGDTIRWSELDTWEYDASSNALTQTNINVSYTGFVSPDSYDNYTFEVRLTSESILDQTGSVVIAFWNDGTTEHTLSAFRTHGANVDRGSFTDAFQYDIDQYEKAQPYTEGAQIVNYPSSARNAIDTTDSTLIVQADIENFAFEDSPGNWVIYPDSTQMVLISFTQFGGDESLNLALTAISATPLQRSDVGTETKGVTRLQFVETIPTDMGNDPSRLDALNFRWNPETWCVVYDENVGQFGDEIIITSKTALVPFGSESGSGWSADPLGAKIRVERKGNIVSCVTTQIGSNIYDENTLIELDLSDPAFPVTSRGATRNSFGPDTVDLTPFNVPHPVGFGNYRQPQMKYDQIRFETGIVEEVDDNGDPLEDFEVSNDVEVFTNDDVPATVEVKEYVYYKRETTDDEFEPVDADFENVQGWAIEESNDIPEQERLWIRYEGRDDMNFAWFHRTPQYNLIDPSTTNIIDMFVITRGYYTALVQWLDERINSRPEPPTPLELRTTYAQYLENKMISDTVIIKTGNIKILFGPKAIPELQAKFKVVRTQNFNKTDNEIKNTIVAVIKAFFDIDKWEFGETFYFTELASAIHDALPLDIDSVVIVPVYGRHLFGDLFQINAREDEIFQPDISVNEIDIVNSITSENIRQLDCEDV